MKNKRFLFSLLAPLAILLLAACGKESLSSSHIKQTQTAAHIEVNKKEKRREIEKEENMPEPSVYTKNFDEFMEIIFQNEGEFSDVAGDLGGPTMYGITEENWEEKKPELHLNLNGRNIHDITVDKITKDDARVFYKLYWDESNIDFTSMTKSLALVMTDTTVLLWLGSDAEYVGGSVEFLQESVNDLGYFQEIIKKMSPEQIKQCKFTPEDLQNKRLTTDGVYGTQTRCIIKNLDYQKQKTVAEKILVLRENFHKKFSTNVAYQKQFEEGWLNRVNTLRHLIAHMEY